jgi:putative transcriptional regulator
VPEALILVARPELSDPVYRRTVLVVKSLGDDRHVGFIVNRPTRMTLGRMFPEHPPSRDIADPVFLGGPSHLGALFALVPAERCPGRMCIEMMPGLLAALDARGVDAIIKAHPDAVRFVMGWVVWRPGELVHEIELGAWYVLEPDRDLALREPEGLWEELVLPLREAEQLIRVRAE